MLNREQLILAFFDSTSPCPVEIPYCSQLRKKYFDELSRLTPGECTSCKQNSIKAKYMKEVWEQALLNTI
jgi:hypothetical protein